MASNAYRLDSKTECLITAYITAKECVIGAGFAFEIDWQDSIDFNSISESDFLREFGWVVFSAGMKESTIRKKFPDISKAFINWASANSIILCADHCRESAMSVFGHKGKVEAVIKMAKEISRIGFNSVHTQIKDNGTEYLRMFSFLGPATARHLAKNIGLNIIKPDRHLTRLARQFGFSNPSLLCKKISDIIGDKDSVVDLVLWRYATLNRDYLTALKPQRL